MPPSEYSLTSIIRAAAAVRDELQSRGLIEVEPHAAILEGVVGRYVTVLGEDDEGIIPMLEGMGYKVNQNGKTEDTILVLGNIPEVELDALKERAVWSLLCYGDAERSAGGLVVFSKISSEMPAPVMFTAKTLSRTKTLGGWEYGLELADGKKVRAASDEEYPNGSAVRIDCDGVVVTNKSIGILNGRVTASLNAVSDISTVICTSALRSNCLFDGSQVSTEAVLQRVGVYDLEHLDRAKLILQGFAGTPDDAISLLQRRAPEIFIPKTDGGESNIEVTRFVDSTLGEESDSVHQIVGVVLEPETPYGPHNVWFSKATLSRIASEYDGDELLGGALNHKDSSQVKVIASGIWDGDRAVAKRGSWVVTCKVTDDVHAAVVAGTYRGFSVKGIGILKEDSSGNN